MILRHRVENTAIRGQAPEAAPGRLRPGKSLDVRGHAIQERNRHRPSRQLHPCPETLLQIAPIRNTHPASPRRHEQFASIAQAIRRFLKVASAAYPAELAHIGLRRPAHFGLRRTVILSAFDKDARRISTLPTAVPTYTVENPLEISVFSRHLHKSPVFSAFFEVCRLRSTQPLAIVQCGPGLFVKF